MATKPLNGRPSRSCRVQRGPVAILRLATVIGSQSDGSLRRVGAFHNVLRWVYRGLLPLIPGDTQTRVELIPTEYVTEGVNRLLDAPLPRRPHSTIFREASRPFLWAN